jgi:hypothetical protein
MENGKSNLGNGGNVERKREKKLKKKCYSQTENDCALKNVMSMSG